MWKESHNPSSCYSERSDADFQRWKYFELPYPHIGTAGQEEEWEGKGILLDLLACFWQKCFISLMIGNNGKVHLLGMTCRASFLKFYIPLNLCHLFVALCLYGDDVITSETLIKSFRQFLATEDREALEKCLGDDFEPNDEDVLDLLTSFKCFKAPSKNNIEAIIIKLTQQELVQRPRYVINYWNPILKVLCFK